MDKNIKNPVSIIDSGKFEPCEISFPISSNNESAICRCEVSLRLLTGRRMTCVARSEDHRYIIKIFPKRKSSLKEYHQEIQGFELLCNVSIDVPGRVYHGPAQPEVMVIVYRPVMRARSLRKVFGNKPESRSQRKLLRKFINLIVRLHKAGLIHEDPHFDNFLVRGDTITTLDTGSVRKTGNTYLLDDNFALFVAQFPSSWQLEKEMLEYYCNGMNYSVDSRLDLYKLIRKRQQWRENLVLKKIYRDCTAYKVNAGIFCKLVIDRQYANMEMEKWLNDPDKIFKHHALQFLKKGHSSTVATMNVGGLSLVTKRYNAGSVTRKMKNILFESRASRSWRNAHRLLLRGIVTARPVAILECHKGEYKGVSWFIMEYVKGVTADKYFREASVSDAVMERVADRILDMLITLHQQKLIHGDLKSTNFIIQDEYPVMIDLDAMQEEISTGRLRKKFSAEVQRFMENWEGDSRAKKIFSEKMQCNGAFSECL